MGEWRERFFEWILTRGDKMKVGDLVRITDARVSLGDMQSLVGHVGVVVETGCFPDWEWMGNSTCIKVFICGKVEKILLEDLEIV